MGCWVHDSDASKVITPLSAFKAVNNIFYAKGLDNPRSMDISHIKDAVEVAKKSDIVLLFAGEDASISGESKSRAFLNFPGAQDKLIEEVSKTGTPIVLVVMAGRPLVFNNISDKVSAILYSWHPGTMGGSALLDLISGKEVPSGRLVVSFPRAVGQIPIYYSMKNTGRPAPPDAFGIPTGTPLDPTTFCSRYLDVENSPEYPFGFGLSYSDIVYSNCKLSSTSISHDEELLVEATITNKGKYATNEAVQLYIQDVFASVTQPVKKLIAFEKIHLLPNESKDVRFKISSDNLKYWDDNGKYICEPGEFKVWISPNAGTNTNFVSFNYK
jgi:beta-glucosidase